MKLALKISIIISGLIATILIALTAIISLTINSSFLAETKRQSAEVVMAHAERLGEVMGGIKAQLAFHAVKKQLREGDEATVEAAIREIGGMVPAYVNIAFFAWSDGRYYTSKGATGSIADRSYFQKAMKGQDYVVGEAIISKDTSLPTSNIVYAVRDAKGAPRGVVAYQLDLGKFSTFISTIKIGESGYAWIADDAGLVIAHPRADMTMQFNIRQSDAKGYSGLAALGERLGRESAGIGEYADDANVKELCLFNSIPNTPNWMLLLSVPEVELRLVALKVVNIMIVALIVSLVVSVAVTFVISGSIVKPIKLVVQGIYLIAKGDLALSGFDYAASRKVVARSDELGEAGRSLDTLLTAMNKVVGDIRSASGEVSSGAEQLSGTSQVLSQGANEQAASIEELSASVEELASTIKQNADNTAQADALSRRVAQNAEESGRAVGETVESMKEIASKIGIIEEIARQTNLLA